MNAASLIDAAPDLLAVAHVARRVIGIERAIVVRSNWDHGADKVIDPEALSLIASYDAVLTRLDGAIQKAHGS